MLKLFATGIWLAMAVTFSSACIQSEVSSSSAEAHESGDTSDVVAGRSSSCDSFGLAAAGEEDPVPVNVVLNEKRDAEGLVLVEVTLQNSSPVGASVAFVYEIDGGTHNLPERPIFVAAGEKAEVGLIRQRATTLPLRYLINHFVSWGRLTGEPSHKVYPLPFARDVATLISQGPGGSFSHHGTLQWAVDFLVPEGTEVRSARNGVVLKAVNEVVSNGVGPGNFVSILHDDDTIAEYLHLKAGSVAVKPFQKVGAGDPLALTGNTGFSTDPHLHFHVLRLTQFADRSWKMASVPIKLMGPDGKAIVPAAGKKLKATCL